MKLEDGETIGSWTVLNINRAGYTCQCKCGKIQIKIPKQRLLSGDYNSCRKCYRKTKVDKYNKSSYINQAFGRLKVLKYKGKSIYEAVCLCGKIYSNNIKSIKTRGFTNCKSCFKKTLIDNKELLFPVWNSLIRQAKRRNIEHNISIDYAKDLMKFQNYKCNLSGLDLTFAKTYLSYNDGYYTASLDRIDSSKGYIEGNVQWVHKDVNFMKSSHNQEYFVKMCKDISLYKSVDLSSIKDSYEKILVKNKTNISDELAIEIGTCLKNGATNKELCVKYNLTSSRISTCKKRYEKLTTNIVPD